MFDAKKITVLEGRINSLTMLLWLLAGRNGGNLSFTNDEIDHVPPGAQLKFRNANDGLELVSIVGLNGALKGD